MADEIPTSSADAPAPTLSPEEQLALLPHDDDGPELLGVLWGLAIVSAIFLAMRGYCKHVMHRGLWWDDYILFGSWIMYMVYIILWTYAIVHLGYGVHSWDFEFTKFQDLVTILTAQAPFVIVAIMWSKTAFGVTLLRLTEGYLRWIVWACIITTNIAMGSSILANFIRCSPVQKTWDLSFPIEEGSCWSGEKIATVHIIAASYSAAMDILLALLPWKLIWGLQMSKREKFGVGVAMSMGIFAGITSILKTLKLKQALTSDDIYDGNSLLIWGAVEVAATIIAASIPVLRVLVRNVSSTARQYYYRSQEYEKYKSRPTPSGSRHDGTSSRHDLGAGKTTVVISTRNMHRRSGVGGSRGSDSSILSNGNGQKVIVTNELEVNYQNAPRSVGRASSGSLELNDLSPKDGTKVV